MDHLPHRTGASPTLQTNTVVYPSLARLHTEELHWTVPACASIEGDVVSQGCDTDA
jgi:hypothetical protein